MAPHDRRGVGPCTSRPLAGGLASQGVRPLREGISTLVMGARDRLMRAARRPRPDVDGPYGIPVPVLTAIGKVAAAAGMLEGVAHFVASMLGRDTRRKQFGQTLDAVRGAARDGLPSYCACTGAELEAWCDDAQAVMQRRNERLHSTFLELATHEGLVPGQLDRKQGAFLPVSEEVFLALFHDLHATMQRGLDLLFAVQPNIEAKD